jgi:hypothetical protein
MKISSWEILRSHARRGALLPLVVILLIAGVARARVQAEVVELLRH